jgi:hypothetical protein
MNYEEKVKEIFNTYSGCKIVWNDNTLPEMLALALKQAYAEGFMDCMNKMMAYVKIETEKEKAN